ncbi:MAG: hypothetical protein ACI8UO_005315 [Verrucomicrobiales bacterium]|jgi:hypothetical protein
MRFLLLISAFALPTIASAQGDDEWQQLPRVPDRIGVIKDDTGFYWQLTGAASFYSMGANTFKSTNMLTINGVNFTADAGFKLNDTRYAFEKDFQQLLARRDVLIDRQRGGVRHAEILKNKTAEPLSVKVTLQTDFSYAWQDVFSDSGKALGAQFGNRDSGAFFRFNPADGQSDVWFLTGGEKADVRPKMTTANNRQVVFAYDVTIPPNGEAVIVHWVGQRTITDLAEIRDQFAPFLNRGRLVRPELPQQLLAESLKNFETNPESAPAAEPHDPKALIGLNRLLDKIEAERTGQELLYMSRENQLSGSIESTQAIELETSFGSAKIALSEVAALRGGGGSRRRLHEIYTRDGEVLIGEGQMPTTRMSGADGWGMDLKLEELEALLLRVGEPDGKPGEGVFGYVEIDDGQIFALAGAEDTQLKFVTPWSAVSVPFSEIAALHPANAPSPRSQLTLKNGSKLLGFGSAESIALQTQRLGEIQIEAARIRAIWRNGSRGVPPPGIEDLFEDWDATAESKTPLIWLEGGTRIAADLAEAELFFVTENSVAALSPADLISLRRTEDGVLDRLPFFELELNNGDLISGRLRNREIKVEVRGQTWSVPLSHFLGYRKGGAQ